MVLDTIKTKKVGNSVVSVFVLSPKTMEICKFIYVNSLLQQSN